MRFQGAGSHRLSIDPTDRPWIIGGLCLIAAVLAGFTVMLGMAALDVWSGIVVALVIVALSSPLLRWVAKQEGDPKLFKILFAGLIAKLLFSMVRFFVIFVVYGGNGDAGVYNEAGTVFARRFAAGEPIHPLPVISAFPVETHWVADVVGVLYTVTSPSAYSGFLVFSYLCFLGQVLMLRGFRRAVPEGDYRRYAVLLLFLPSLLFWPSSIGKEALMLFCLGLVTYGGALLLAPVPKLRGVWIFSSGILGLAFVRPHIALMSIGALGVAMAIGVLVKPVEPGGVARSTRGRAVRAIALVALLVVASFALTRFGTRFAEASGPGTASASSTLAETTAQTAQGGSEFSPIPISSPDKLPFGVMSVVFRPLPWEARSINALIAAAETILLVGLFAVSWRRLLSFPKLVVRRPFLVFSMAFVVAFAIGFSYVANFGILARQRVQMQPFLLMLLALPIGSAPTLFGRRARRTADGEDCSSPRVDENAPTDDTVGDVVGTTVSGVDGGQPWPS